MRFLFDADRTKVDFQDTILPIQNLKNIKKLAYDSLDHYIYFIENQTIKRVPFSGQELEVVINSPNAQPIDLVIDPYARILFWICNITNSINVTRIIGSIKPLSIGSVHHSTYDKPRFLAYHLSTK